RNIAVQAAYMHDGVFRTIKEAIQHHLDVVASLDSYDPTQEGLPPDLRGPIGPIEPMLARLDPLVSTPRTLSSRPLDELVPFVGKGLSDRRARPQNPQTFVPKEVPRGCSTLTFEFSP